MHSLISFDIDDIHYQPPQVWGSRSVIVRPLMEEAPNHCPCQFRPIDSIPADLCLQFSNDSYEWTYGDPAPRFASAGVS